MAYGGIKKDGRKVSTFPNRLFRNLPRGAKGLFFGGYFFEDRKVFVEHHGTHFIHQA